MSASTTLIPLAPFLLVAFLALLAVLVLLGVLFLATLKAIFGKRKNRQTDAEEAQLMQDLNRNLQKLEERVESLETIMLETGATRHADRTAAQRLAE